MQTRGDRDLLLNSIHSTLLTLETIRPWEKNPDIYSSGITNSAFTIMERKFAPPADRLRALIAREKQMPAALQQARANLKNPPHIYHRDRARNSCPDSTAFFQQGRRRPRSPTSTTQTLKKEFATSNAAVIEGAERLSAVAQD